MSVCVYFDGEAWCVPVRPGWVSSEPPDLLTDPFLSPLKNMEAEHLNDALGNPGLISPDKEDLSRLLVRRTPKHSFHVRLYLSARPGSCAVSPVHLYADGALQRTHPGRHEAREEDHCDGHC